MQYDDQDVIDKAYDIESIYGKAFFFQQRRGKLDLRRLSQLDLDRIVRNVDIDCLQNHLENITFANLGEDDLRFLTDPLVIKLFKTSQFIIEYLLYAQEQLAANLNVLASRYNKKKRTVAEKRREIAELRESVKQYKADNDIKRNNIATLEELLRNAGTSRRVKHRRPKEEPVKSPTVTFFISGPNGQCIEFHERTTTTILELMKLVQLSFVNKKNEPIQKLAFIKLSYRGAVLSEEGTLLSCNVQNLDTMVAIIEEPAPTPMVMLKDDKSDEWKAVLEAQQRTMADAASDMRQGMADAMKALRDRDQPSSKDVDVDRVMEDRWNRLEKSFREMMEKMSEQKQPTIIAGHLENDDNEELDKAKKRIGKLEDDLHVSGLTISELRAMLARYQADLDEIRKRLSEPKTVTVVAPAPAPASDFVPLVVKKSSSPAKSSKWKKYAGAAAAPEAAASSGHAAETVSYEAPKEEPVPVKVEEPVVEEKVSEKLPEPVVEPAPAPIEVPPVVVPRKRKAPDGYVMVPFPFTHNSEVEEFFVTARGPGSALGPVTEGGPVLIDMEYKEVCVPIKEDIDVDDIVYELRKHLSDKAGLPIARMELSLRGQKVRLGLDIDESTAKTFTAAAAADAGDKGELIAKVTRGKPLTDSQIDLLVYEWEKRQLTKPEEYNETMKREGAKLKEHSVTSAVTSPRGLTSKPSTPGRDLSPRQGQGYERLGGYHIRGESILSTKKSRSIDDSTPNEEKIVEAMDELYSEMDSQLSSFSDTDGMTDDELQRKSKALRRSTDAVSKNVSSHIKSYHKEIASSVTSILDANAPIAEMKDSVRDMKLTPTMQSKGSPYGRSSPGVAMNASEKAQSKYYQSPNLLRLSKSVNRRRHFDEDEDNDNPLLASVNSMSSYTADAKLDDTSNISSSDAKGGSLFSTMPLVKRDAITESIERPQTAPAPAPSPAPSSITRMISNPSEDTLKTKSTLGSTSDTNTTLHGISLMSDASQPSIESNVSNISNVSRPSRYSTEGNADDDFDEDEQHDQLGDTLMSAARTGTEPRLSVSNTISHSLDSLDRTADTSGMDRDEPVSLGNTLSTTATSGSSVQFDLSRTIDSEGEMVVAAGGGATGAVGRPTDIASKADEYERRAAKAHPSAIANKEAPSVGTAISKALEPSRDELDTTPQSATALMTSVSPDDREDMDAKPVGSTFSAPPDNSGNTGVSPFDNLQDVNDDHSLALSDSGMYDDNLSRSQDSR